MVWYSHCSIKEAKARFLSGLKLFYVWKDKKGTYVLEDENGGLNRFDYIY
jgi:hypothetical protein